MMRKFTHFLILALLLNMVACTQNEIDLAPAPDEVETLKGYVSLSAQARRAQTQGTQTKMSYEGDSDEGFKLSWEEGDSFSLYKASDNSFVGDFQFVSGAGEANAQFRSVEPLELEEGAQYVAQYPARSVPQMAQQTNDGLEHLGSIARMSALYEYSKDASSVVNFNLESSYVQISVDEFPLSGMESLLGVALFDEDQVSSMHLGDLPIEGGLTLTMPFTPSVDVVAKREVRFAFFTSHGNIKVFKLETDKNYEKGLVYSATLDVANGWTDDSANLDDIVFDATQASIDQIPAGLDFWIIKGEIGSTPDAYKPLRDKLDGLRQAKDNEGLKRNIDLVLADITNLPYNALDASSYKPDNYVDGNNKPQANEEGTFERNYLSAVSTLSLPNVTNVENSSMKWLGMESLYAPKLELVDKSAMANCFSLKQIYAPEVREISNYGITGVLCRKMVFPKLTLLGPSSLSFSSMIEGEVDLYLGVDEAGNSVEMTSLGGLLPNKTVPTDALSGFGSSPTSETKMSTEINLHIKIDGDVVRQADAEKAFTSITYFYGEDITDVDNPQKKEATRTFLTLNGKDTNGEDLVATPPFGNPYSEENDIIKFDASTLEGRILRTFYVDGVEGDDNNDGLSPEKAFRSLEHLLAVSLKHGDQILLRGGNHVYTGMVEFKDLGAGSGSTALHVGSYGGRKARIDAAGYPAGVLIDNSSHIYVTDLKIKADGPGEAPEGMYMIREEDRHVSGSTWQGHNNRYGVFLDSRAGKNHVIDEVEIYNLDIREVYFHPLNDPNMADNRPCREWSTNYETEYGWGIRGLPLNNGLVNNVKIHECNIRDVSHTGIKFVGANKNSAMINNLDISKCNIYYAGGPGAQFARSKNGKMYQCTTVRSGASTNSDGTNNPRKWGRGSGMWIHTCDGFLFERNYYERAEGIADCCGAHIDIGNKNVIIQYCLSVDNMGGFVEVLGQNYNCAYRYNISINDGWRNSEDPVQKVNWWGVAADADKPIGTTGAMVTINGHTTGNYDGPFQTYIYNNTVIYHDKHPEGFNSTFTYELATSAEGILMANNIFWVDQPLNHSWSKHAYEDGIFVNNALDYRIADALDSNGKVITRDMSQSEIDNLNHFVRNNLWRHYDPNNPSKDYLPNNDEWYSNSEVEYWDELPRSGDPMFRNYGGFNASDYIPSNADLINSGIEITKLASDLTNYGLDYRDVETATADPQDMNLTEDIFGNKITRPILGAVVPQ